MIVIIGNGIAGITLARNIRKKSSAPITIISGESKYFFSRTALMYVYMGHMKFEHTQPYEAHFWEDNNFILIQDYVESINNADKILLTRKGDRIQYEKLVIASGSKPNKFGWKGQDAEGVRGMYSKQDLEYIESKSVNLKSAVIVGGGLIGIEMAEMFLSRNIEVHFLVRENSFWNSVLPEQDSHLIMRHFEKHHGLNVHYGIEMDEVITNANNEAIGVRTNTGEEIKCEFVGLTAGVTPNIDFVMSSSIETNRGVSVNEYFETSDKDVYAIGDCAEFKNPIESRRSIEQVWYTGKIMGENLAQTLCGDRTKFNPGHWFNSAKFFDIEYQTYGRVHNSLQPSESEFVFEDREKEILVHFIFDKVSHKFMGVNTFGLRLRHAVFNDWLLKEATIEDVLTNLKSANFDPEFHTKYEGKIISEFNQKFDANVVPSKAKWWQNLIKA